jgi:hypothetical protein
LKETRLLGTTQVGWGNWPAVERMALQVVSDVAAKRRVVGEIWEELSQDPTDEWATWLVRLLAAAYEHRAGYREEWVPSPR